MKHMEKSIINIILLILLASIFFIINIFGFDNSKILLKTKPTTIIPEVPVKDIEEEDTIYIDSQEIKLFTSEYVSHLGFKLQYESTLFNLKHLSNGTLVIVNKDDENNYIKIEKLSEYEYYKEYEELNLKEEKNINYLVNYKFLRGNSHQFLKITKSIDINNTNINGRLDYVINSLSFTSN